MYNLHIASNHCHVYCKYVNSKSDASIFTDGTSIFHVASDNKHESEILYSDLNNVV